MNKPYKTWYRISQGFSKNFSTFYKESGYTGHTGIDMVGEHLAPIYSVLDSYCYSHVNRENNDLRKYRAVYTLCEINGAWYEISYGHLMDIVARPKTYLKAGDQLGTQGATGDVFFGGERPTEEQRLRGVGSHLHFQMRAVKQVDRKETGKKYLTDMNGTLKWLDKYWEVINHDNGFSGCVDPQPFFDGKVILTAFLKYGMRGEAVKLLQTRLGITADGIFGPQTSKAVIEFQTKNGLVPDGIVGKLTNAKLNL